MLSTIILTPWTCSALFVLAANGDPPPSTQPAPSLDGGSLIGDSISDLGALSGGQIQIGLRIYPAISRADLARYARWLNLSEAQQAFSEAIYQDYCKKYRAAIQARVAALAMKANQLESIVRRGAVFDPSYLNAYQDLVPEVLRVNAECDQLAEQFFACVEAVLAEVQQPAVNRVLLDHERRRRIRGDWDYYPSAVDLAVIVEQVASSEASLAAADSVLLEYELSVTPLVIRVEKEIDDLQLPLAAAIAHFRLDENGRPLDLSTPQGQDRLRRNEQLAEDVRRRSALAQESVLKTNKQFAARIAAALSEEDGVRFTKMYQNGAYPDIYPDQFDPQNCFDAILHSDSVAPDMRNTIAEAWKAFCERIERLNAEMQVAAERNSFELASTGGHIDPDAYPQVLTKLQFTRARLNKSTLRTIETIMPAEAYAPFKRQIEIHIGRIDEFLAQDGGDSKP